MLSSGRPSLRGLNSTWPPSSCSFSSSLGPTRRQLDGQQVAQRIICNTRPWGCHRLTLSSHRPCVSIHHFPPPPHACLPSPSFVALSLVRLPSGGPHRLISLKSPPPASLLPSRLVCFPRALLAARPHVTHHVECVVRQKTFIIRHSPTRSFSQHPVRQHEPAQGLGIRAQNSAIPGQGVSCNNNNDGCRTLLVTYI